MPYNTYLFYIHILYSVHISLSMKKKLQTIVQFIKTKLIFICNYLLDDFLERKKIVEAVIRVHNKRVALKLYEQIDLSIVSASIARYLVFKNASLFKHHNL